MEDQHTFPILPIVVFLSHESDEREVRGNEVGTCPLEKYVFPFLLENSRVLKITINTVLLVYQIFYFAIKQRVIVWCWNLVWSGIL